MLLTHHTRYHCNDLMLFSQNFASGDYVKSGAREELLSRVVETPSAPWSTGQNWSFRYSSLEMSRLHIVAARCMHQSGGIVGASSDRRKCS